MYDSEIRAEVIFKKDLTFEKAVEFVLEKEKAAKASKELEQRKGGAEVCATSSYRSGKVGQAQQRQGGSSGSGSGGRGRSQTRRSQDRGQSQNRTSSRSCYNCGEAGHLSRDPNCPARDKECHKCHKKGHVRKCC